jgi:hypothetical protein
MSEDALVLFDKVITLHPKFSRTMNSFIADVYVLLTATIGDPNDPWVTETLNFVTRYELLLINIVVTLHY